jgi:hypothetical protein
LAGCATAGKSSMDGKTGKYPTSGCKCKAHSES